MGGLATNHAKAAELDKVQDPLDAEMAPKCDLLCVACHVTRKRCGLGRWEELPDPLPGRSGGEGASSSTAPAGATSKTRMRMKDMTLNITFDIDDDMDEVAVPLPPGPRPKAAKMTVCFTYD